MGETDHGSADGQSKASKAGAGLVNGAVKSLAVSAAAPVATSATQGKLTSVAAKSMGISSTLASNKEDLPRVASQLVRQAALAAADA
jgi:hypothetical protein